MASLAADWMVASMAAVTAAPMVFLWADWMVAAMAASTVVMWAASKAVL